MRSNRFWCCVLGLVLLVSAFAAVLMRLRPADRVRVYQDGELIESIVLANVVEPYSFTVECEDGMNVIALDSGRIRVADADCPDLSCVRQGWHSGGASPIVCLPHRLVIEFERLGESQLDAIA